VKPSVAALLLALTAVGLLLLLESFHAPTELDVTRDPARAAVGFAYLALCGTFAGAPALLVRQFAARRPLLTAGLAFCLWSVLLIGMILVGLLSRATFGAASPVGGSGATMGGLVVLCFAAAGFLLFSDHLWAGGTSRSLGRSMERGREAMRARRRRG